MEARSLKTRQGWFLLEAFLREPVPYSLLAPSGFWQSLAFPGLQMHHSSLCLWLHMASSSLCVSVSKFPSFYREIGHIWFRATLFQYDLILTWLHLSRPCFQIRLHPQVLGRCGFWGDTIQPSTETVLCWEILSSLKTPSSAGCTAQDSVCCTWPVSPAVVKTDGSYAQLGLILEIYTVGLPWWRSG